jgi:outer membrane protein OmpA-like peptidoglycan-associated protein
LKNSVTLLAVLAILGASTCAQAQSTNSDDHNQMPTYSVSVVSRTTAAVKYEHRRGSTKIDFAGTALMPGASGVAEVASKSGAMKIEAEFRGLDKPTSFGTEYLTYVMWAISPEGRPVNLGEVLVNGDRRSKLDVTTNLQSFALVVTAEPYYAVRRPSNVVVAENVIRPDTVGTSETLDAKYELIDRGGYIPTGYHFDPVILNLKLPLEFFEARNAVRIAQSAGAETYAGPSYEKAVNQMKQADDLAISKHSNKRALISASREVVQTADDSREIAVKRIDADRLEADKDREAGKLANAQATSRSEMHARMTAESANEDAQAKSRSDMHARMEAESANADAQAKSRSDMQGRMAAESANADAQARSNNDLQGRMAAESANADAQVRSNNDTQGRMAAESATADANRGRDEADRATSEAQRLQRNAQADSDRDRSMAIGANLATADAQRAQKNAEAESDQNRLAAASSDQRLKQAVQEKEELRAKLLQQFNVIFATRDTARGLIVNLSDVLFDTGKSTLRPGAREKLAKISGIVLAYPDLRLAIEGNTDSVGSDATNQVLSEQRANSVREYLLKQNIPSGSMTSKGFGKTQPVATNDTAEGRQANRRVEMVVSGEVIGTTIGIVSEVMPLNSRP